MGGKKRNASWTQVQNLRRLPSPFGQGLTEQFCLAESHVLISSTRYKLLLLTRALVDYAKLPWLCEHKIKTILETKVVHWGDWQRYLSYYCLVTRLECGLLLSGDNETHEWSALAWRSKGVFLLPFGRGPACSGFAALQTHGSHKTEFEMKKNKTVQDALFPWLSLPAISLWKFCRVKVAELLKYPSSVYLMILEARCDNVQVFWNSWVLLTEIADCSSRSALCWFCYGKESESSSFPLPPPKKADSKSCLARTNVAQPVQDAFPFFSKKEIWRNLTYDQESSNDFSVNRQYSSLDRHTSCLEALIPIMKRS